MDMHKAKGKLFQLLVQGAATGFGWARALALAPARECRRVRPADAVPGPGRAAAQVWRAPSLGRHLVRASASPGPDPRRAGLRCRARGARRRPDGDAHDPALPDARGLGLSPDLMGGADDDRARPQRRIDRGILCRTLENRSWVPRDQTGDRQCRVANPLPQCRQQSPALLLGRHHHHLALFHSPATGTQAPLRRTTRQRIRLRRCAPGAARHGARRGEFWSRLPYRGQSTNKSTDHRRAATRGLTETIKLQTLRTRIRITTASTGRGC